MVTMIYGRKAMTKLDSILKSRDIYFPTKVQLVKAMVFPVQFTLVHSFSHVQHFATSWTAAHQASLSITNSWSFLKFMSIESVMPSNRLILCHPLFLPPSTSFLLSQFFTSGGQSIRVSASASVLPVNIQD